MEGLTEEAIYRVFALSRHSHKEAQRMMQFLRFREVEGNTLFARIEPDADVTAFVMPHYADRFPQENFIIADTGRKLAGIHAAGQEWFLVRMEDGTAAAMENLASYDTEEERELAEMFRRFCQSAAVKERDNRALQQQLLPLKYRAFMTDFEKEPGVQSRNKT